MKEEKTKSKKSFIYYLILGICVLLIVTATVLTIYFVTQKNTSTLEGPPVDDPDKNPDDGDKDDPDKPSDGSDTVKFVVPLSNNNKYTMAYGEIWHNETVDTWYRHYALDFLADAGTEVVAMADGEVLQVSTMEETGNLIVIDHGDGLVTSYRFVEPVKGLGKGDEVKKGDKIGEIAAPYGSEAHVGEHLHLEDTLNDVYVDPGKYIEVVLQEK